MAEAEKTRSNVRNNNSIIILITAIVLAVIFLYCHDRQQQRRLELQRIEAQMDVWEEWGRPRQNRQTTNTSGGRGGKIL